MINLKNLCSFATACCVASLGLATTSTAFAADSTWEAVKDSGELRCGAAIAAPYVMKDPRTNDYSGFFVEMCREFADHLGVEATFVDTNWDNLVAGVQSHRWDLGMALNETPQRAKAIQFSEPVSLYQVSFLYNKDNPKLSGDIDSLDDIDKPDITIAVMSGTVQDKTVTQSTDKAKIMRLPGMDETRLAVMSHRADVLADANDTNLLFQHANPDWAKVMTPTPPLASQGVAFGVNKSTPEADMQELNEFIAQKKESGEIQKMIDEAAQTAVEQMD
ncbi:MULTISPECIES: transporter substrate-binding domain-containing protein [unclassified Modicisalibacter]|uniref:transporter substrate-binding domain-containing protein n=1 Tax=unclassified Modicisalibacter TaxID=2679913 RepID=UPI001CCE335F|nr:MULTISPECIES: transporter substrate-binding domain-containing protein [unclassified Modicisalibacter]MBZ9557948.1 transporter substrate-binding domain-containing protein [Modicisalibacter sp. R2A 31.J]MBZ9573384.1 transporter substrate-binding domain-containing protein [Modicisalibacter sp. MOD 31.J]